MAILAPPQIGAYAYRAGVRDTGPLATAIAIAIAESGGNTRAHNATPPDDSYGLWQINMLGGLGPERRSSLGLDSNEDLFDPEVNARAMFRISNQGTNWRPWTTYNGLRYRAVWPVAWAAAQQTRLTGGAVDAIDDSAVGEAIEAAGSVPEVLGEALDYAEAIRAWLADRHNWVRIMYWGAGLTLLTVGLLMVARPAAEPAIQSAKKVSGKVADAAMFVASRGTSTLAKSGAKKTASKTATKGITP